MLLGQLNLRLEFHVLEMGDLKLVLQVEGLPVHILISHMSSLSLLLMGLLYLENRLFILPVILVNLLEPQPMLLGLFLNL